MRLQNCVPPLDTEVVQALCSVGVKTDSDLLLAGEPMDIFAKLAPGHGIGLKTFNEVVAQVAQLAAAVPVYADKAFQLETKLTEEVLDDGVLLELPELDNLLGGFGPPRVIEFSGDTGSGKTALALHMAIRHLSFVEDSTVLWIDSSGEFSAERVSTIIPRMEGPYSATALQRLQVSLAFDIEAVHEVLESLRQSISTAHNEGYKVPRLVIIDTIASLLGPMLSATSSQGHAVMTTFMRQLRALAELSPLTVIVINSSTRLEPRNPESRNSEAVFEMRRKPTLGPSFTFLTDATLWLSRRDPDASGESRAGDESTLHTAEVLRSRITRSKTWACFKTRNGLVVEA
ncbi:P-loop containing nucleoside triphosphate hydrolase protein [Dichomitus squalens]|uniref:P-loop containing nucleoside triphosphate hydrolase protein n=1 Tax=Dichomitus squalens TaxID=114155 RepID=A0A4Q9PMW6_9APHY|nr:P-loop containing nucleoside triphosphate hydrolase protein [Dichomitus squalens]TBU55484.1 P-loop containing nucleoside triphosphate hydrolase protein [Dichomitus squalens]